MKTYRRKMRMTTLMLFFVMMMVAGSAYALTSAGPLVFEATANVDFRLRYALDITAVAPNPNFVWGIESIDAFRHGTNEADTRRYMSVSYSTIKNDLTFEITLFC